MMVNAARELVGTHDFRAFMASGSSVKGTVRTIAALTVEEGYTDRLPPHLSHTVI